MTGETPYEKLNTLQNPNVRPGQNFYMRGVTQREYSPEVVKRVFDCMCEVSSKDFRVTAIFELFPLDKINSVSNDAMAFNIRGSASNILCISAWDENTPENAVRGKGAAYAVTDIISDAEKKPEESKMRAYGNYGLLFPPL